MAGTRHCYVGAATVPTPAYQLFVRRDSQGLLSVDVETFNHDHGAFAPLLEHLAVARVFRGLPDGCPRAACAHLDVLPAVLMQVSADGGDGQASSTRMVVVTPGFVGAFSTAPQDGAVEAFVTCADPRPGADPARGGIAVLVCTHTVFLVSLGVAMPRGVVGPATTAPPPLGLARAVFDAWAAAAFVVGTTATGAMQWDPARFHFPMVPWSSPDRPRPSPDRRRSHRRSRPPLPAPEDEAGGEHEGDDVHVRLVACAVLDGPAESPVAAVWQHSQ